MGLRWALLAAVVLLLGLQFHLALAMAVNWDEFYFLSQVYAQARGELSQPINTFHVHLFQWLRLVPGGEINQIVAGRLVMLACEAGTAFFLARVAGRLAGPDAALATAVVYLSIGEVIGHGASFRTDPLALFLVMASLWLLVCSRLGLVHALAAGVLAALAGLVTVKAVFHVPALAIAAVWRIRTAPEPRRMFANLLAGGATGGLLLAGLFLWHRAGLAPADVVGSASSAYRKTLRSGELFPRWAYIQRSLLINPLQWLLVAGGVAAAAWGLVKGPDRWRWLALLALAAPLVTLVFYRNAFPYFFAFMLAPVCVLAGLAMSWLVAKRALAVGMVAALVIGGAFHYALYVQRHQHLQRAVVSTVHRTFPTPVAYFDRASMIGSFPQAGFFMSTWGMENYRAAGRAVLKDGAPVFTLVGHPAQVWALAGKDASHPYAFLPDDAAFLRDNFISHWGPIWVAGKRLEGGAFEVEIAGAYTLEAPAPVEIDGRMLAPGQAVRLEAGAHRASGEGVLRWGERLYRPAVPPPAGQLYWDF